MVYRHKGEADEGTLHEGERTCRTCEQRKPITEFHWANRDRHRRRTCKACDYARSRKTRTANPEKYAKAARARALKKKYGLTLADFDALLVDQNYRCRVCWTRLTHDVAHVDHDHATGAVRGVLCINCNVGLGNFFDDPWRLQQAITYLHVEADRLSGPQTLRPSGEERPVEFSEDVA